MKKNLFLKLASGLLVLCLASTCAIGTTFAKYVTGDKASDTARVAKWGIAVSTSGTLFGTDYEKNSTAATADRITATSTSVSARPMTDSIVAPGTLNDVGFKVEITGTPEVEYDVTATNASVTLEDIWLDVGNYGVMIEAYGVNIDTDFTGNNYYNSADGGTTFTLVDEFADITGKCYRLVDTVTVTAKYFPLQWSVATVGGVYNQDTATLKDPLTAFTTDPMTNLASIAEKMADNLDDLEGLANDKIDASYVLTWKWVYETNAGNISTEDKMDTILGNLMAGNTDQIVVINNTTGYEALKVATNGDVTNQASTQVANLTVAFGLQVAVTQVD